MDEIRGLDHGGRARMALPVQSETIRNKILWWCVPARRGGRLAKGRRGTGTLWIADRNFCCSARSGSV